MVSYISTPWKILMVWQELEHVAAVYSQQAISTGCPTVLQISVITFKQLLNAQSALEGCGKKSELHNKYLCWLSYVNSFPKASWGRCWCNWFHWIKSLTPICSPSGLLLIGGSNRKTEQSCAFASCQASQGPLWCSDTET